MKKQSLKTNKKNFKKPLKSEKKNREKNFEKLRKKKISKTRLFLKPGFSNPT